MKYAVIEGLARVTFSDECSYEFYNDVYHQSVNHSEPLQLAVVLKGDDAGPALCVWTAQPFTETISLSKLHDGDNVFKPTICVHVAQASLACDVPDRMDLVEAIMDSLLPMITKFAKAVNAGIFDAFESNSGNANLVKSIQAFQDTLCTFARAGIRRTLTDYGVCRSPVVSTEQMQKVLEVFTDPTNGYFDSKMIGARTIQLIDRRLTYCDDGYGFQGLDIMITFGSTCDARQIAMEHEHKFPVIVVAPNCTTVRMGWEMRGCHNGGCFEVFGVPMEFLAMVLPHFMSCYVQMTQGEDIDPIKEIGSPFSHHLDFYGHGYKWKISSVCGNAITDRQERNNAINAVSRVLEANLERIKAKLWRPQGRLCAKMMDDAVVLNP